jgi:hypothetical protein
MLPPTEADEVVKSNERRSSVLVVVAWRVDSLLYSRIVCSRSGESNGSWIQRGEVESKH